VISVKHVCSFACRTDGSAEATGKAAIATTLFRDKIEQLKG
jgi:hypothetical protein